MKKKDIIFYTLVGLGLSATSLATMAYLWTEVGFGYLPGLMLGLCANVGAFTIGGWLTRAFLNWRTCVSKKVEPFQKDWGDILFKKEDTGG